MRHVTLFDVECDLSPSDHHSFDVSIIESAILDDGTSIFFDVTSGFSMSRSSGIPLTEKLVRD